MLVQCSIVICLYFRSGLLRGHEARLDFDQPQTYLDRLVRAGHGVLVGNTQALDETTAIYGPDLVKDPHCSPAQSYQANGFNISHLADEVSL
jgi:hypothetical protein